MLTTQTNSQTSRHLPLSNHLPRILCIGTEALTKSHGTGQMMARHFSRYPRSKIIDMHFRSLSDGFLFPKIHWPRYVLRDLTFNSPLLQEINSCITGKGNTRPKSLIYSGHCFATPELNWNRFGGPPDLIYSTCYSADDFAFLHHVYRHLPKKVPIIQNFLDLDLRSFENMFALYQELLPAIVSVGTLTKAIHDTVSRFSFVPPEMCQALHQRLSKDYKTSHRRFSKNFRPIVIGNIWSGSAFQSLHKTWSECQHQIKELGPIAWFGHPRRFEELGHYAITMNSKDKVIRDGGFLPSQNLKKKLISSDLAIVAFSGEVEDKDQMTTFSLPSRIGDYCASGLPIVVISRKDTEPWRLIGEHNFGIRLDPANPKMAVRELKHFIQDREWRAECGANARKFAEQELDLSRHQKVLYRQLLAFAKTPIQTEILKKRFSIS